MHPSFRPVSSKRSSKHSGVYDPGPVNDTQPETDPSDVATAELTYVQKQQNDLMLEEFPDGPYGAATNEAQLGKSEPWRKGQIAVSAWRDQNPVASDRTTPVHEPDANARPGSIEGQN